MFRWRFALYGALVILVALGVYWRMRKDLPAEESSVAGPGQSSPAPPVGSTGPPSSGDPDAFPSRAAKRVQARLDSRLILVAANRTTGAPISDAEIRLYEIDSRSGKEAEFGSAYTNSRGEAGFDPPQGNYVVTAHHPRFSSLRESVEIGSADSLRKSLLMTPGIGVAGVVADRKGQPKPQTGIAFSAADGPTVETSSGADGAFQVWLQPGRYDVVARDADAETNMHGVEIWQGREFFLEIRLGEISPSIPFSGQVQAAHGPVSDAIVKVWPAGQPGRQSNPATYRIGFYHSARTGTDGGFALKLPPVNAATLAISAPGHEILRERVDLRRKSSRSFRLQQERGFHLKVIDGRGNIVPGVEIVGVNRDGRRVVQGKGRFVYSSSEYPFEIYAVDRRSGLPITGKTLIQEYQPEIQLDSPGR